MAQYIPNEVPVWLVNSSNMVYTTVYPIQQILSITVDGLPYFTFSFTGRIITLVDAPTLNIYVTYIWAGPTGNSWNLMTYGQIKTSVFDIMDQNSDSGTYAPLVPKKINAIGDMICKGIVTSILDEKTYTAGDLGFLYDEAFFTIVTPKALTGEVVTSNTEIFFDTTDYEDSGRVWIGGEKIRYASKTSTKIQGLTSIKTTHSAWDSVEQLFTLPTSISLPFTVFLIRNNCEEEIPAIDERFTRDAKVGYSIVNASGINLLRVIGASEGKILMKYYKKRTDLEEDSDICVLPDKYPESVLAMIVAGELLYQTEEVDNGATKLKIWYNNLNNMYKYYASRIKKSKSKVIPQPYNYSSLTTWYWFYGKRNHSRSY